MRTVRTTAEELPGEIEADMLRLHRRVTAGLVKSAVEGAHAIEPNIPVASAELRGSLHVDAERALAGIVRIVLDAPHAGPVEEGSRPHVVPLEALVAWVKLRGAQGLTSKGKLAKVGRKAWGSTTAESSRGVAKAIKQKEVDGVTPVDAALEVARAIQHAIAVHGTRPHWMVRKTIPKIAALLDENMQRAVKGA